MAEIDGDGTGETLQGATGEDNLVNGNGGNDRLVGGGPLIGDPPSNDTLNGGEGDDTLLGLTGSDMLFGGPGDDELQGGPGAGGFEDDTLDGGPGADVMIGQAGNDVYFVDDPGDRVAEFSSDPADEVRSTISVALLSLESAAGGDPNVIELLTLLGTADIDGTGNALDNTIAGNAGDNALDGGAGTDTAVVGVARADATVTFEGDAVVIESARGTDRYGSFERFRFTDQTIAVDDLSEDTNTAPVAVDDSASTQAGTPVLIDVLGNDGDADGDTLSLDGIAFPASNGAVGIDGGQILYTPNAGFTGADSFTYGVADGMGGSDIAVVTVTVDAVTPAPPPGRDAVLAAVPGAPADAPFRFDLGLFYDTDFGDFSVASGYSLEVEDPDNATVTVDGDTLEVRRDPGYSGLVGLRYSFGSEAAEPEVGRLAMLAWDTSLPVASPIEASFGSDSETPAGMAGMGGDFLSFAGLVFGGDEEQARLDREGIAPPDFGINGMSVAALANADLSAVLGAAVNDDGFLTFDLEIGGEMVFAIDLDQDVDAIDAVPGDTSSFLYRVRDPGGNSSIGVFSIEVGTDTSPNAAPVAVADRARTAPATQIVVDVLANDTDADGGPLTLGAELPDGPRSGTATLLGGGRIAYTPDAGFTGTDSFVYAVSDGRGGLAVGTVEIGVGADPDTPVAAPDSIATDRFVPVTIDVLANDSDPDGDPLTVTGVTRPGRGGVRVEEDGTLSYAPRRGFTGEDSFDYTVSDGRGGTATATVTIGVADLPEEIVTARVVAYLYEAAFGRFPDLGGVNFWIGTVLDNTAFTQKDAASAFLRASEFESLFGSVETLTDTQLIEQLYLNVLDRPGEAGGISFWEGRLALPGVTREDMLLSFAESAENQFGSPRISTLEEIAPGEWDFA